MKKFLVYGVGGFLGLVLLLVLGLYLFFPYDTVRSRVETEMSKALNTEVKIAKLGFSLLPTVKVSLEGLEIAEEATPDLPKVSVGEIRVGVSPWPLLSKKIVVNEVFVSDPRIEMILSDAKVEKEEVLKEKKADASVPYDVNLKELRIRGLELLVRQSDGSQLLHIKNLSETLSASASTGGKLNLEGELNVESWRAYLPMGTLGRGLPISFKKKISFDLNQDELSIEEADLALGQLPLSLAGSVQKVRDEAKRAIDLTFKGGPAEIEKILGYIPISLIPAEAKDVKSSGKVSLNGFAKGILAKKPDFSVDFRLENGRIAAPVLPAPIEGIEVRLAANPKKLELATFTAKTVNSSIQMNAIVTNYDQEKPSVDGQIEANVNLKDVAVAGVMSEGQKVDGSMKIKASFDGTLAPGENLASSASGSVSFSKVSFQSPELPVPVKSLDGSMELNRGDFKMPGLKILLGESDATFQGYLKDATTLMDPNADTPVKFDFAVTSKRLNLDELIPATKEEDPETKELTIPKPLQRLVGEARLTVANLRVNKLEAKNVKGKVHVKKGILTLDGFDLDAFGGNLALKGAIDYTKPSNPGFDLDVDINQVKVDEFFAYAENLNKLAAAGKFLKGRFSASTKVGGNLKEDLALNMSTLDAAGKFKMKGGEVSGHPVQSKLAGFLNAPSLKELPVHDWVLPFSIKNGKLEMKQMTLAAKNVGIDISGWQSITGQTELNMDVELPKSMASAITKHVPSTVSQVLLGGEGSDIVLPFKVGGKTVSPTLTLQENTLASRAKDRAKEQATEKLAAEGKKVEEKIAAEKKQAQEKLKAEQKKVEEKAKSKAKSTVKNLLGTETKKTDSKKDSEKKDVKDKAKGLVKDLF